MIELLVSSLIGDHMVLQRHRSNPVWGWDRPQQTITLTVERPPETTPVVAPVTVTVDATGAWRVDCPELPAGGPYRLRVRGSTERVIEDVLVGEVWLATGQSNMEFNLSTSEGAAEEIARADTPQIRLAYVQHAATQKPELNVAANWSVCSPQSAGYFSAVAYHFARELHRELDVPIGIVNATWGGTRVEAWTSVEALRKVSDVDAELAKIRDQEKILPQLRSDYEAKLVAWGKTVFPADPGISGESAHWSKPEFNASDWEKLKTPGAWQTQGLKHNGAVWFRRSVEIPPAWAGNDLQLSLGVIDDFDETFFNGERVGRHPQGTANAHLIPRRYTVPGSSVKAGLAVIATRVFDQFGEGGFLSPPEALTLHPISHDGAAAPISLAGDWSYRVELNVPLVPTSIFKTSPPPPPALEVQNHPAALFHGMIAPIIPYGIRGAIWYQGESNVYNHSAYHQRFTAMIRDWRARWGIGQFPFYFVQLANFRDNIGWAHLREAQAQTLAEPATGMAVAIDIGEGGDIHPRNKRQVGLRLARIALSDTYAREDIVASGPTLDRITISDGQARVFFKNAAGLRTRTGVSAVKGFSLAAADGVHHAAAARIDGASVVVASERVPAPQSVRYAFTDDPEVNLENAAGLPAAPFRTD